MIFEKTEQTIHEFKLQEENPSSDFKRLLNKLCNLNACNSRKIAMIIFGISLIISIITVLIVVSVSIIYIIQLLNC